MRTHLKWGGLVLTGAFALTALGCPKDKQEEAAAPIGTSTPAAPGTGTTAGTAGKKYRIAVIPKGTANSFWQSVKAGADAAGGEDGLEIVWQGPSREGDITDQINVVQNQTNNHVDGIVLAACDSNALVQPAKDAMAKGIPVVTVDSGVTDKSASVAYIATDNVKGGAAAADYLAKVLNNKGKIGLMPFLKGAASSDDREQGFTEEIKKFLGIQIVSTLYTESDVAKANDQTANMLTAHPDIVGIFAANEPNGIGAANVLKQRKLNGKVQLVAYDASKEELAALNDGTIQALIVQDPFQMGYLGVKTVLKAIKKETITEKTVDSGFKVVTKDNLNDPAVQKLLK